jgi:predicted nucleotidyltransferase
MQNLITKSGLSAELLKQITELLKTAKVDRAVLYGSRARGDYTDASDIDIAFWGETDEAKLWAEIELLPTIHKVDLVNFNTLTNEGLKKNILHDAIELVY